MSSNAHVLQSFIVRFLVAGLICWLAYLYFSPSPYAPERFFTDMRRGEMADLSDALLSVADSEELTVAFVRSDGAAKVLYGSVKPHRFPNNLESFMKANQFHYVYVSLKSRSVSWMCQRFNARVWYSYSPDGSSAIEVPGSARSVKRLDRHWVWYLYD